MEITIGGFQVWIVAKLGIAIALTYWETRHNTYKPHQLVRRYLTHAILTEWTAFKFLLGCIGWVFGKGFPVSLWPICTPAGQTSCRVCKDTGRVKRGWRDRGRPCACVLTRQWATQYNKDHSEWRKQ